MTFACRTFQGMGGATVIQTPTFSMVNTSTSPGLLSSNFGLNSNGTTTLGTGATGSPAWVLPTGTGVGSAFWVKLTVGSTINTTPSGDSTGTVLALSSNRSWTFTNSSGTVEGQGTFTLTFYSDAGGTVVVGSGSGSWDVGQTH